MGEVYGVKDMGMRMYVQTTLSNQGVDVLMKKYLSLQIEQINLSSSLYASSSSSSLITN